MAAAIAMRRRGREGQRGRRRGGGGGAAVRAVSMDRRGRRRGNLKLALANFVITG